MLTSNICSVKAYVNFYKKYEPRLLMSKFSILAVVIDYKSATRHGLFFNRHSYRQLNWHDKKSERQPGNEREVQR